MYRQFPICMYLTRLYILQGCAAAVHVRLSQYFVLSGDYVLTPTDACFKHIKDLRISLDAVKDTKRRDLP